MACLPTKILIEFGRYQIISISVSTARLITAFLILCYAYLYPLKWENFHLTTNVNMATRNGFGERILRE